MAAVIVEVEKAWVEVQVKEDILGYEQIESVGFVWTAEGISMATKNIDAMRAMKLPQSVTDLPSFLGLANQFRERVSGFAPLVANLTALTRGTSKSRCLVITPEAIIEFENFKAVLASAMLLQQFKYDRKTYVYTDASVVTQDSMVAGSLGVVIVQEDPMDGRAYICACASSGLSSAQRNYHIVRLELLAIVFACGKFHDWLASVHFLWRTDCRAHQYLEQSQLSTNQTIAQYSLTLQEYSFAVEWIPGMKMIADPFSRMVLLRARQEAFTLSEILFHQQKVHVSSGVSWFVLYIWTALV